MTNSKKIVLIILVIVTITMGLIILNDRQKSGQPQIGPFALGIVTKITGQTIYFSVEGQEKTVTVSQATKIIKQVKDRGGLLTVADAKLDDIKIGSQIVVYYSTDKIQILNE